MTNLRSSPPQVPREWAWTKLGEITQSVEKVSPEVTPDKEFTYLDIASVDDQSIVAPKNYLGKDAPSRARQLVKSEDVLFSTVRTYLKRIAMVGERYDGDIASTGFCVIRPWHCIDSRLIFYLVQADTFVNSLTQIQRGTSYPAVRDSDVFAQLLPLPPIPEQHRIVAKIDELFTRLDAGEEALNKVKAQLKAYRQAVLRDALEGKHTAEWREAHKGETEPASALLERIKAERKRNAKGKFKELPPLDTSNLPQLPEGWVWTRVGELSETMQYGYTAASVSEPVGPKMLRITDIQNNCVDWEGVPHCKIELEEKAKYILREGDLVFARTGATVGKSFLISGEFPETVFASYLIRVIFPVDISKKLVYYFFQSNAYWSQIRGAQIGIGQPNVNSQTLSKFCLPLAPLAEQHRIVEEIERCFSIADEMEKTVEQGLKQAERLRQSILKRAFEGRLVPQDPSDEPAETLLERIKVERASRELQTKSMRKSHRETTVMQRGLV